MLLSWFEYTKLLLLLKQEPIDKLLLALFWWLLFRSSVRLKSSPKACAELIAELLDAQELRLVGVLGSELDELDKAEDAAAGAAAATAAVVVVNLLEFFRS